MITEQYVTFETARMLKEAGFDVPVHNFWNYIREYVEGRSDRAVNFNRENHQTSRPSQPLAVRWLQEVHKIHLFANYFFEDCDWFYVVEDLKELDPGIAIQANENSYKSAEEALEAGLQAILKLIIKNNER